VSTRTRHQTAERKAGKPKRKPVEATGRGISGYLLPLLIFAVVVAVFARVSQNQFLHWDDGDNITNNPFLRPPSLHGVLYLWTHAYKQLYVPLVYTTYALEITAGGWAGVIHLTNAVLHALSAVIVFQILTELLPDTRSGLTRKAAGLGALLFALHPIQVEAVAWATGRKDVLSGLLCLCSIWQFVLFRKRDESARRHFALAMFAFVLSLLAKPASVATPLAWMALDYFYFRRSVRSIFAAAWPALAVALGFTLLTTSIQSPSLEFRRHMPAAWTRPFVAADAICFYVQKIFLPAGMAAVYGRTPAEVVKGNWMYIALVLVAGACYLIARYRNSWSAWAALFLIFLLPVSGIVPFVYQRYSTVADRYAYVSMLGVACAAAGGLRILLARRDMAKGVSAVSLVIAAILAVLSFRQIGYWQNSEQLWKRNLTIASNAPVAHTNLATLYLQTKREDLARKHYEDAVKLDPTGSVAQFGLGLVQLRSAHYDDAIGRFKAAIEADPDYADAYANLAEALARKGNRAEAIPYYQKAIAINPANFQARFNLGATLAEMGRYREAEQAIREILSLNPRSALAYAQLGVIQQREGDRAGARKAYERSLELNPKDEKLRQQLQALQLGGS
jgi:tetratricopeptide (TPR) repeat protein